MFFKICEVKKADILNESLVLIFEKIGLETQPFNYLIFLSISKLALKVDLILYVKEGIT